MVVLDHRCQARLVDRDDAVVKAVHLGLVDVHAHHLVADFGQAGSGDESDVAGSEDRNAHAVPLPYSWFASGLTISSSSTSNTRVARSEEHTSELQSLMRTSYAVFCLK